MHGARDPQQSLVRVNRHRRPKLHCHRRLDTRRLFRPVAISKVQVKLDSEALSRQSLCAEAPCLPT